MTFDTVAMCAGFVYQVINTLALIQLYWLTEHKTPSYLLTLMQTGAELQHST